MSLLCCHFELVEKPRNMVKYLYVYIVRCSDNTFYAGVTNNVELRIEQHNSGIHTEAYTYSRRPVKLEYCELFTNYNLAIDWETRIKKWSAKKKQALIDSDWEALIKASKSKNRI